MTRIDRIAGRAIPLRGHDIDTDRIMPARFLKAVTFEGLEAHVFEDDRRALEAEGRQHPFSNPAFRGASILVVNGNFGSGSSREHAPQGLQRWGIRGIVGESFSEIFFGNATTLGLPCLTAAPDEITALQDLVERDPGADVVVSIADLSVVAGGRTVRAGLPRAAQEALLSGSWDATGLLLDGFDQVESAARRLPYLDGFR